MARCDAKPAEGKPRPKALRYTIERRAKFVRALAEHYDVEAALKFADLTWPQVCELRFRFADFGARIDEVIDAGFDRLEADFLRLATASLASGEPNIALVQAVMKLRRPARAVAAPAKPSAKDAQARTQVDRIMAKIAQLNAAQAGSGGNADGGRGRGGSQALARCG